MKFFIKYEIFMFPITKILYQIMRDISEDDPNLIEIDNLFTITIKVN